LSKGTANLNKIKKMLDNPHRRRAGHRARRLWITEDPGIWSARWPTLLNFIHEIDIEFHEVSYKRSRWPEKRPV
jgi:hypothetical protein